MTIFFKINNKNQIDVKSYPQESIKNDIFMLDIPLNFNEKSDLSTDLSTGNKIKALGVQKLHSLGVQKLHPNLKKVFLIKKSACARVYMYARESLKGFKLFSRKKEGDFMDYQNLKRLNDIINCFLLECATLTKEDDDLIEKTAQMDGYEVYMICKERKIDIMNTPTFTPVESLYNTNMQNQSEYLINLVHVNKNGAHEKFTLKILAINFHEAINKIDEIMNEMGLKNFNSLEINKIEVGINEMDLKNFNSLKINKDERINHD